jgi:chorismate dehydratase
MMNRLILCSMSENIQVRVGVVNYLNTRPLMAAFDQGSMRDQIIWKAAYPSNVANELMVQDTDLALIPVAVIPEIPNAQIVSKFGIAASGPVASVCIFSEVPLEEITHLYLDYQSRTSVRLTEILLKNYWKMSPVLLKAEPGYEAKIQGKKAGVVIGDRALMIRNQYRYIYDLAEAWLAHTQLPFVFATWVANKPLSEDFLTAFSSTLENGLNQIDSLVEQIEFPAYNLHTYYTENIDYRLTPAHIQGMNLFLEMLKAH